MKDYRVTIKVRNNRILRAIEAAGGRLGNIWCESHGMNYSSVVRLVNMAQSPLDSEGRLRESALRLCEATNTTPDDLWSKEQLYPLEKNFSELEMDQESVLSLVGEASYDHDVSALQNEDMRRVLLSAMEDLTDTAKKVIHLRYWEGKTLAEVGRELGKGTERIRQIEANALRLLRYPTRRKKLLEAMG